MPSHRMHLKGPWDILAIPGSEQSPESRSVTLPQSWRTLFGPAAGTARFRRAFHCPTNLDPHETVWIVLTEVGGAGQVWLNDQPCGTFDAATTSPPRFEITSHLKPRNHLTVEVTFDPGSTTAVGGLYGAVALEIVS
jgi:hypothetical protein